ncbi:DsbA family protein [Streptomyces sp. 4N509B]|uniref:DsbA family protein n=1 Tax=Streptomyces sp. 4N509B TaxID=3457413 RepID=UPI003FD634B9
MPPARAKKNAKKRQRPTGSQRPGSSSRKTGRPGRTQPPRTTYGARAARPYAVALLVALLVGAMAVGTLAALGGSDATGADDDAGGEPTTLPTDGPVAELARRDAGDPLALGEPDAPVVMIEYADFQDAFVGIHARRTHQELVTEYVEAGILRIEFRNYPVNGPESDAAARAAWAAGEQGRFWEFHDAALAEEFSMNSGRFEEEGLRELADRAGVEDVERLLTDMESEAAGEAVGRDAEEAYELGVTSVPSFLINGEPVQGVQSPEIFRETIDEAYEAAR